jgi:propanol-preferring alcohol dehydrogenase
MPKDYSAINAAPLLCAGLIGYRSYKMTGKSEKIGLYGFGAAAHIIAQVAVFEGKELYAFTKPGDAETQNFALTLGCKWAGDSDKLPPDELDSAIIFAPAGSLVPAALKAVSKGGTVVCAGIHMSDIPSFSYDLLWGEREIKSVANLTRKDGEEFFNIAPKVPVKAEVETFALEQANGALEKLRNGKINGAAVLVMDQ